MKRKLHIKKTTVILLQAFTVSLTITIFVFGCSKGSSPKPTVPRPTVAQLLMQGGEWGTTAGTFYTEPNCQGSTKEATGEDLGDYGIFALCGVTFFTADSVKVQDEGNYTWSVSGANPTHLKVNFEAGDPGNTDDGDSLLDAQIVSIDSDKLVITENTTFFKGYASYKQTLTAHFRGH